MPNSRQHPDNVDREILELLGDDARQTAIAISEKLNLTSSTVRRRIKQLEEEVIVKYTVILDHAKASESIEAYLELHFHNKADITGFLQEQVASKEIREGALIAGDVDAIMRVRVRDRGRLAALVTELRQHPVLARVETHVSLERVRYVASPAEV